MEIKEMLDQLESKINSGVEGKAKDIFQKEIKAITDKIEADTKAAKDAADKELETKLKEQSDKLETIKSNLEKVEVKIKTASFGGGNNGKITFKGIVKEALKTGEKDLKDIKSGRLKSASIMLKAAGDEEVNFSDFADDTYSDLTTERRGLWQAPFAPLWLRQLFPTSSTLSDAIRYVKENGGDGAAAIWDGSGDIDDLVEKPGVGFKFTKETETIDWIAGVTRVPREMLDDVSWLQSYITQQLTTGKRGLFVAENAFIASKLNANNTAYDGDKTIPIEMLYDAGFGQLRDNYYNPSAFIMNHRDVINLIAFNKAAGSGEYDLPNGTVSIIGGQLYLSGVPVVGAPNIAAGSAYVFDQNATQFITRMNPEVRLFEQDRDNVVKNLITIRAEERIGMLILDNAAIVKVDFAATT